MDRFLSINPNLQQIISALTKGVVIPDDQYLVIDPYKKQLSYFGEDELRRAVFPNATVVGRDGTQIDPNVPENLTIVQIKLLTKDVFYPYQHILIVTDGIPILCCVTGGLENLMKFQGDLTLSTDLLYDALTWLTNFDYDKPPTTDTDESGFKIQMLNGPVVSSHNHRRVISRHWIYSNPTEDAAIAWRSVCHYPDLTQLKTPTVW